MADKMVTLYATRSQRVYGKNVSKGDKFEVPSRKAKEILLLGRASDKPIKEGKGSEPASLEEAFADIKQLSAKKKAELAEQFEISVEEVEAQWEAFKKA